MKIEDSPGPRKAVTNETASSESATTANGRESPAWGWLLMVWMALVVVFNGAIWTTGVIDRGLAQAVEDGAAEVEKQHVGEDNEDVVRKEIQTQRDTLRFWTVIAAIRDFVIAPLSLGLRAIAVAVALSAAAATAGRPVRFDDSMHECVAWQGVWVAGLAVRLVLMFVLNRSAVSTSLQMFLAEESYTASTWLAFEQLDCFALIGWLGMAWGGWHRGQAGALMAVIACVVLATIDVGIHSSASLVVNLGMRMSLMPQ
jgi:hypothetical protein